jgi:multidrug efflux pump subunit AcrA (membrane-fusion protein)
VGSDATVEMRAVEPGAHVGELWVIEKGLKPGESVIVAGLQYVKPGMPVTAKPASAASPAPSPASP